MTIQTVANVAGYCQCAAMKLPSLHYQCWVDYRWPVYQSWQSLKCEKNYLVSDQFEFDHSLGYFGFVGVKDSPWGSGYFGAAMVLLSHENQGLWLMIGRKGWWLPSLKQGSWECVINYKGINGLTGLYWFGDLRIPSLLFANDVVFLLHWTVTSNTRWGGLQPRVK